ncbi:MAG: hypothetical protein RJA25_1912 [Bacteroidota bacterium]|jgi:hypothetical protein
MKKINSYFSIELFFWIISLIYLGCINPSESHFSFCVFKYLGINWCLGCGIGHSISYLLHGELFQSIHSHILGIFALAIIVYRIIQLLFFQFKINTTNYYGESIY